MSTDRTQRARTQADRWTPHVAENINSDEGLTLFAESRAARLAINGKYLGVMYRDGSATVLARDVVAAVNPMFTDEAELLRDQRDSSQPWLLDLFAVLDGKDPEYRGEARTGWELYLTELRQLALEYAEAGSLAEPDEQDEDENPPPPPPELELQDDEAPPSLALASQEPEPPALSVVDEPPSLEAKEEPKPKPKGKGGK